MHLPYARSSRLGFAVVISFAAALSASAETYFIQKAAGFIQTGPGAPTADPLAPYVFEATWPGTSFTNLTLTAPTGRSQPIPRRRSDEYDLLQGFPTKAALDAAFPNGTYTVTAAGRPNITFGFGNDLYPTTVPQILSGGTWNAGGLLVLDPTQANTIRINAFSEYGSAGVGSAVSIQTEGDTIDVNGNVGTQSLSGFGLPVSGTPSTSLVIPARTYTSGRVYRIEMGFLTAHAFTVSGGAPDGVGTFNSNFTTVYVAALAPGATAAPAPVIARQPADVTARVGTSATFTISPTFNGSTTFPANGTFTNDWYFNGQTTDNLDPDRTKYSSSGTQLIVRNVTTADAGDYSYRIVTTGGIVSSAIAKLIVTTPPVIATAAQPVSRTVVSGATAVFSVVATGVPEPTYQWRLNNTAIPGATSATLVVPNATAANAGNYTVVATNSIGTVTSNPAALTISASPDFGRIVNLSILTSLAAGEGNFTVGAVIGGAGTSGAKPLLVRAVGPTLGAAPFNIPGTLPDPKLDFYSGSTVVASNDNWGGTAALTTAFTSVGAFPYLNATTRDAAIFNPSLAPGAYTIQIADTATGTGSVIAELYDATPGPSFTPTTPRLVNVSVLKQIPAGAILTTGFVIGGSTAKTVLIRVVGPTLGVAPFNIPGAMADPQLVLFNSASAQIATNDNWGGDAQLAAAGTAVGAFALSNAASKDAILLVTLPPGNYTAQASGVGNTGGRAIIEVYEVP